MGLYQNLILFLFLRVRGMYHYVASEEEMPEICFSCVGLASYDNISRYIRKREAEMKKR